MPTAASRPCATPTCHRLQPCADHPRIPFATARRASSLYDTARWKQERKQHLAGEPYCRSCGAIGTFVDHIIPPRGNDSMFFERGNWQTLCRPCSNAKTGRETRERYV